MTARWLSSSGAMCSKMPAKAATAFCWSTSDLKIILPVMTQFYRAALSPDDRTLAFIVRGNVFKDASKGGDGILLVNLRSEDHPAGHDPVLPGGAVAR